jgi:hypothetical protein
VRETRDPSVGSLRPQGLYVVSTVDQVEVSEDLLDLVDRICGVVHDTMDLLVGRSVNIGQQPVAHDVGLDSPCEG